MAHFQELLLFGDVASAEPKGCCAVGYQKSIKASASAFAVRSAAIDPPLIEQRSGVVREPPHAAGPIGGVFKRLFDILFSSAALVVFSPVIGVVWLAVRLESGGPAIFWQRRSGFQGRPFFVAKFRSMRRCDDRVITQATASDARVTRFGGFLRRTSLDELPQLINVLRGEMSIVGPRPHALAHDRHFWGVDARYPRRYHARPGITGLAQVSGSRGPTDTYQKIAERTSHDICYITTWSWMLDMKIILRTFTVLLRRDAF